MGKARESYDQFKFTVYLPVVLLSVERLVCYLTLEYAV